MSRRTIHRTYKQLRVTVANSEVAVRGMTAYGDPSTGTVVADPDGTADLVPLGYFTEDLTGDGSATTLVDLFEEIRLEGYDNDDAPDAVAASDVFTNVYAADGSTVSTDDGDSGGGATRSVAGRVFLIDSDTGRVFVRAPRI